jgi:DMSO/TMAO reductase YedYZ molybdopterin-dependent catalytic subunit
MQLKPPPGPFRPTFWRSPIRGPWLTSVLGLVLFIGLTVVFVTGLLSYAAYNPDLGNDPTPDKGLLGFYLFDWPTRPGWLYQLTQGLHVFVGLALIPVLLAKLWSVIPRFFAWPPVRSPAQLLERLTLVFLVGGAVFEFVTGLINIQYWYVFPAGFYASHLYGAWVFIGAMVLHVVLKTPKVVRVLRTQGLRPLRTGVADTRPEPPEPGPEQADTLVPPAPAPATISRRGLLALVGGGSLLLLLVSVGQTIGGPLRRLALLAPRGGAQDFPVNKTAESRGVTQDDAGPGWRLELRGARTVRLTRDDLLAMLLHTEEITLACVEGWSTTRTWTGVRLRDLARLAGAPLAAKVLVESLQTKGGFRAAYLRKNQILDPGALLALQVDGEDLSLDHGFPARIIVPNNPGVHNTKWVSRMTFEG